MSDSEPIVIDDADFTLPGADADADSLVCLDCGRDDFKNARGLSRHRSIAHGIKSQKADKAPRSATARNTKLDKELTEMFMLIGMLVSTVNQYDGMVILQNADTTAQAWAQLARTDKRIASMLDKLISTTAYSGVILATIRMAVPILANHGVIPPELGQMFGPMAPPPSPEANYGAQET